MNRTLATLASLLSLTSLVGCGASDDDPTASGGATTLAGGSGSGGASNNGGQITVGGAQAGQPGLHGGSGGSGGSSAANAGGTSGSAGSGGSSGSGGTPHVASPCDALPDPGSWESILPDGIDYSDAIVVDPYDAAIVWLSVANHGIFKSTDCAATWTNVSGDDGTGINSGEACSMVVDPVNQGVMYATASNGSNGMFKSTNAGVDWTQLFTPDTEVYQVVQYNLINSIAMEAANPNHLVVTTHAHCSEPYGAICEAESTDAGETWKITTAGAPGDDWIAGAGVFIIDSTSWLFGTYSAGLWLTTDSGSNWKDVTAAGAWGSTSGKTISIPFMPSAAGTYYLADEQGVIESTDAKSWTLIPNSGGRSVGIAFGDGKVFSSDQWSTNYHQATESDLSTWNAIDPPSTLAAEHGAPYLAYDSAHHILYSSNWAGGLWRQVIAP